MGQWGVYDDENDQTADLASVVEADFLPNHLINCFQHLKSDKIPCYKLKKKSEMQKLSKEFGPISHTYKKGNKCEVFFSTQEEKHCDDEKKKYIQTHTGDIGKAILKSIKKKKYNQLPDAIAGIAIYLARGWHSTPIFPTNNSVGRGYQFPKKLPKDFPPLLKKMAHKASLYQLDNFDNKLKWRSPERRIQALKNQVKLFK